MGKSNIKKVVEAVEKNYVLWSFLESMIMYYLSLRRVTFEQLSNAIGYSNKSSMTGLRGGYFTPRQLECIIDFLKIESLDANRMRAKYWAAFCECTLPECEFNRLYAEDAESTIRELHFENKKNKEAIDFYKKMMPQYNDFLQNDLIRFTKKKP